MKTITVKAPSHRKTFSVSYYPDIFLEESVRRGAPETYKGSDIWRVADSFKPAKGDRKIAEVTVVRYEDSVSSEEVIDWAKSEGLVPADPRILLALTETIPDIRKEFNLSLAWVTTLMDVILGGYRQVPSVHVGGGGRDAYLARWDGRWYGRGLFVLVPQV